MLSRRFLRIKALKALYSHACSHEQQLLRTQKNMLFSVQKSYELYPILMNLCVEVSKYSKIVVELNKKKFFKTEQDINPNMYLVNNRIVKMIAENEYLNKALEDSTFSWEDNDDIIKKIYTRMSNREYYKRYVQAEDSFENDKEFLKNFYRKEVEDFEPLYERIEEVSVYWYDDIEFITCKCLSNIFEIKENTGLRPYPVYQKDEDRDFVINLLAYSIKDMDKNIESIKGLLKNWEIERVALMDKLAISLAMTEINHFPLIPVNVILNEYIEVTKFYSTPNSGVFVNGILDKYISSLKSHDALNKTGKGLE
ncbi:MAG: hypothetical protein IMY73_03570 [Bacteroidetes bacterium]|nr:hypothetical protein [Bacteroidota bacterium]